MRLAASAERGSEHPLGAAIVRAAQERGLTLAQPERFEAVAGRGISAVVDGRRVLLGNLKLMREQNIGIADVEADIERLQGEGKTAMIVAADGPSTVSCGFSSGISWPQSSAARRAPGIGATIAGRRTFGGSMGSTRPPMTSVAARVADSRSMNWPPCRHISRVSPRLICGVVVRASK